MSRSIPIPADAGEAGPPELKDIFGTLSACACEHCQSALSPAAYFIDLLNELTKGTRERNPAAALFNRRPDLRHIRLNCDNTTTELPYIDLVNEVLEAEIAKSQILASSDREQLTAEEHQQLYNRQTIDDLPDNLKSEDRRIRLQEKLRAQWQHQILDDDLYRGISNEVPWVQPFEPDHVKAQALMKHFGINAEEWLEIFGEPDDNGLAKAAAHLGLSRGMAEALTDLAGGDRDLSAFID